jgi:tRNA (cmo5U34)-methyltransferase
MTEIGVSHHKTVAEAFGGAAGTYDQSRRRLVPCFDEFYATAVQFASLALPDTSPRVLDLGAGTGLLSLLLAGVRPDASFTLVDAAAPMLAKAERLLTERGIIHEVRHQDLAEPLPPGAYDAVVSALAIHHLPDAGKRDLMRRIRTVLAPGGAFVNAEQVAGETPRLDAQYDALWESGARALGSDDDELAAARARMAFDLPATVDDQLRWLTEAGFADVCCPYRNLRFAVLAGRAPRT